MAVPKAAATKTAGVFACALIVLLASASVTVAQLQLAAAADQPSTVHDISTTEPIIPTTSAAAPTTTAAAPTTTAAAPTTTAAAPTTTAAAPTTTAAAPTTTAAPAPSTTAAPPTPMPPPAINRWAFSDKNVTCLIVQMAAQLNMTYQTIDNDTVKVLYNLPANNHTVGGQCGNVTDLMNIVWDSKVTLNLEFRHADNDSTHYELAFVHVKVNVSQFANAHPNQTIDLYNIQPHYKTHSDMSYHCTRPQQLDLAETIDANATAIANLEVSQLQFEAFHHKADDRFSTAKDCDAVDTPDIVPIAVGCALAALVALVLIAFLVGRRRSQTRGYLAM